MNSILRLEAMDAQRFDLSKRRKNPSNLAISTVACGMHWEEESGIPQITVASSECSPSNETSTTTESSFATHDSTPSSLTVVEATIFTHKNDTQSTDIFERDGYTTTRTIIRPTSPRSISSIFSRPSSPLPGLNLRPNSPLGTKLAKLADLSCMGSTDAFEEELDLILKRRENELAGVSQEIKIKVTQDHAAFYEEKWRDTIQALLYENTPPLVSRVSHVHAY